MVLTLPSPFRPQASVPGVLGDLFISNDGERCLGGATARKTDPEATLLPLNPGADMGSCSIRESCCPTVGNETISDEECEQLCTTGMNPLERYTINLGSSFEADRITWKDVLDRCAESGPSDQKFCRFIGQYSTNQQYWSVSDTAVPLFENTSTPGSRFCLDPSAEHDNSIVIDDENNVVIFVQMAPRTAGMIFHPIAQGKNSVGFGGVNYTDQSDGRRGWIGVPVDPGVHPVPVKTGKGVVVTKVMPPTVGPDGGSFAFRGTEAAVVASTICGRQNHRQTTGSDFISMPGLFPRMLDLEFGPNHVVTVDQCRDIGAANITTLGDILQYDLYGRGGGLTPGWWRSGDVLGDTLKSNGVFSDTTDTPMTFPVTRICTTAPDSANRCTGPCDLTKTIVDGVVGGLSAALGVFLSAVGDFGFIVKLIGLETAIGGGTSIMNAVGADSGSLVVQTNTKLLHARLRDTADGFLIRTDTTAQDSSMAVYENFPSMLYACADAGCTSAEDDIELHTDPENPVTDGGAAETVGGGYTYSSGDDKWHGKTRLHRTQTVAGNFACATAVQDGGGSFKDDISSIHISDVRRVKAASNFVEFGVVDSFTLSQLMNGGDHLYSLVDESGSSASPFPTSLGTECSLCASIGSPGKISHSRSTCTIADTSGNERKVAYDLHVNGDGVGYDIAADSVFFKKNSAGTPRIDVVTGVSVYNYENTETEIARSDQDPDNVVNRLLGRVVGGGPKAAVPRSPCFSSNDVVEICSFDSTLRLNGSSAAACQTVPSNWNTSLFPRASLTLTSRPTLVSHARPFAPLPGCPSPRWANDRRVVFPTEISEDNKAYPVLPNDFEAGALHTGYCANSWGQTSELEPFQDNNWFMTRAMPADTNIAGFKSGAPSEWLPDSQMYVYCAGDQLSVGERHAFCGGTEGIPEGRGTYEGLRLENRQTLGQVCKDTGTPSAPKQTCLLYVGDPGPFGNPTRIGDIAAAFPSTDVEIVIVPANFTAVSMMALYLAFVDTTYYNDASFAPPNLHREAGDAYVIGRKMKLPWSDSAKIVPHMCSSSPDVEFFSHLYAWIERHRNGNSNTYTFFNLDSGTGPGQDQTITMTDAELYPGIQMQGVVKPGLARITVRSAFDSTVAAAAAAILGRDSLSPRWAHFRPSPIGGDCTRFRYVSGGILLGSVVPHTPAIYSYPSYSSRSPAWNRGPRSAL